MHAARIEVYCRVKPTEEVDRQHIHFLPDHCTVQINRPPRATAKGKHSASNTTEPHGTLFSSFGAAATAAASPVTETKPSPPQCFTLDGVFYDHNTGGVGSTAASGGGGNAFGHGANTQESVYATTVRDMLTSDGVLGGTSATVLCYGAKGTGKSYTMFGSAHSAPEMAGIAQRAIADLYRGIADLSSLGTAGPVASVGSGGGEEDDSEFSVHMTVLQLQGERVADMLALGGGEAGSVGPSQHSSPTTAAAAGDKGRRVNISLDGKGEVVLKHVRYRACPTAKDALACLADGLAAHRATPQHGYCHLVVSFHIHQRGLTDSVAQTRKCVLHLVDLAGTQSQRTVNGAVSNAEERHLASAVNQSLTMLQQVVLALGAGNGFDDDEGEANHGTPGGKPYIPYRQSKLTTLLKGAMGGRCLTTLIAHVKADRANLDATLHTLQFAKRSMSVVADPKANVTVDAASQVRHLQRQLTDLRAELRLQAQISAASVAPAFGPSGNASVAPPHHQQQQQAVVSSLAADEVQQVHEKVHAYVDGHTASLQVSSVREMQACFAFLRSLVEQKEVRVAELVNEKAAVEATAAASAAQCQRLQQQLGSEGSFAFARKSVDGGSASSVNSNRRGSTRRSEAASTGAAAAAAAAGVGSKGEVYSPSVLDVSVGVGYGTSARANPNAPRSEPRMNAATTSSSRRGGPSPSTVAAPAPPPPPPAALSSQPVTSASTAPRSGHADGVGPHAERSVTSPLVAPLPQRPPSSSPTALSATDASGGASGGLRRPHTAALLPTPSPLSRPGTALLRTVPLPSAVASSDSAKTAAFEAYKCTPAGIAQLQAMRVDQGELQTLQRRAEDLGSRLEQTTARLAQCTSEEGLEGTSTDLIRPLTALSDRPATSQSCQSSPRPPTSMNSRTARQLGVLCHALQEQLAALGSERAHLQQQLERRRTGLLRNFEEWYTKRLWEGNDARQQVGAPTAPPVPHAPQSGGETEQQGEPSRGDGPVRQTSAGSTSDGDRLPRVSPGSAGKRSGRAAVPSKQSSAAAVTHPTQAVPAAAGGH